MNCKQIGAYIASKRKGLHLSQQALAEQLGVTNKAVSKWECGDGYPDITLIPELAKALGVTADELFAGKDGRPASSAGLNADFDQALHLFSRSALLSLILGVCWMIFPTLLYAFSGGHFYLSYIVSLPGTAISLLIWLSGFLNLRRRSGKAHLLPHTAGWLSAGLWLWGLPLIPWMEKLAYWAKGWFSGQITDSGEVFSQSGHLLYNKFWGRTLIFYIILMTAVSILLLILPKFTAKERNHDR